MTENNIADMNFLDKMTEDFESSVIHMAIDEEQLVKMDSLLNNAKYQQNLKDLEKYKKSYKSDFFLIKEELELHLKKMENEIDYGALEVSESFQKEGIDLEVDIDRDTVVSKMDELKKYCVNMETKKQENEEENDDYLTIKNLDSDDEEYLMINQLNLMHKKEKSTYVKSASNKLNDRSN
jgi:hypothetical protein